MSTGREIWLIGYRSFLNEEFKPRIIRCYATRAECENAITKEKESPNFFLQGEYKAIAFTPVEKVLR